MKNKKHKNEPMEAPIAVRVLADAVGLKWKRMLMDECDGLGHIHDMWNEMYHDMDAIVCLEKYVTAHKGICGCDFGTPRGFEKYDEVLFTEEGEQNGNK